MLANFGVQMIFNSATLNPCPPLFNVDLEDLVHMFTGVDHNARAKTLRIGSGPATAGIERDFMVMGCANDTTEILVILRTYNNLWIHLVDAVIGGKHCASRIVTMNFALKTQCMKIAHILLNSFRNRLAMVKARNHRAGLSKRSTTKVEVCHKM